MIPSITLLVAFLTQSAFSLPSSSVALDVSGSAVPSWVQTKRYIELASASSVSGKVGKYEVAPAVWMGRIFGNGPKVTIQGPNFSAIMSYIHTANPRRKSSIPHHRVSWNETQPINGTQPIGNGTQPIGNATQPIGNTTQPIGNATQLIGNATIQQDCTGANGYPLNYPCGLNCNNPAFGNGNSRACYEAAEYMATHEWPGTDLCGVYGGRGKCARYTCSWDSSAFLCNDGTRGQDPQWLYCREMSAYIFDIYNRCPTSSGDWPPNGASFNGQRFRTDLEYSVLFARTDLDRC